MHSDDWTVFDFGEEEIRKCDLLFCGMCEYDNICTGDYGLSDVLFYDDSIDFD